MSANYIRTITSGITTASTNQLFYTVPAGSTFIAFSKSVVEDTTGGGDSGAAVTAYDISVTGLDSATNDTLSGTYTLSSGEAGTTSAKYVKSNGAVLMYTSGCWVVGTSESNVNEYGGVFSQSVSSTDPTGGTWINNGGNTSASITITPSSSGESSSSSPSGSVSFKSSASASAFSTVAYGERENVKELYEAGESIYINGTATGIAASITGILFGAGMVPVPAEGGESSSSEGGGQESSSSGGGSGGYVIASGDYKGNYTDTGDTYQGNHVYGNVAMTHFIFYNGSKWTIGNRMETTQGNYMYMDAAWQNTSTATPVGDYYMTGGTLVATVTAA